MLCRSDISLVSFASPEALAAALVGMREESDAVFAIVFALPSPFSLLDNVGPCDGGGVKLVLIKKARRFPTLNFSGGPTVQFFRPVIPKFDAIFHIADHDCVLRKI